ncbi:MAG: PH domain-containing protein [Tissierellia bacterium]|nr:PH domain-containing protein [Tissierellia bacterium]
MYKLIMLSIIIVMNISMYFSYHRIFMEKRQVILLTKLSKKLVDDPIVKKIVKRKKKIIAIFLLAMGIIFSIMSLVLEPVIAMISNVMLIFIVVPFIIQSAINELREFKRIHDNNEFSKKYIDFDLIRKSKEFKVPLKNYIKIGILYFVMLIFMIIYEKTYSNLMWIIFILVIAGSDFLTDYFLNKSSVVIYSKESEVNLKLNEKIAKGQSKILFNKSLINSVLTILLLIMLYLKPYFTFSIFIFMIAFIINTAISYYLFNEKAYDKEIKDLNYDQIEDDLEYFDAWGYKNPNDKRLFIKDPYGVNTSVNRGVVLGKIIFILPFIILICISVLTAYLLVKPTEYEYKFTQNELKLQSNVLYHDTIKTKDIKNIELKDDFDKLKLIRTSGNALEKTSTGNYKEKELGKLRIYIYNDNNSYVLIKTKDKTYLINEKSEADTRKLYEKFKSIK